MKSIEELQKIIDQFDENELRAQAIFGISLYGGGSDESFIKANKEGLELFALELLKAAREVDNVLSNPKKDLIPFDSDEDWVDENSDTFIHYIEPIAYKQKFKPQSNDGVSFGQKLIPLGIGVVVIGLLLALLVGLYVIFNLIAKIL